MYKYYNVEQLALNAQSATTQVVDGIGVSIYICTNPDDVGPDFVIDPADAEGIAIFREFAAKIHAHYNTLLNKQP